MSYHKIAVDSNADLSEMKVFISEDGENWIWLQGDDEKQSAIQMQYICFEHKEIKDQPQLQVDITVYRLSLIHISTILRCSLTGMGSTARLI